MKLARPDEKGRFGAFGGTFASYQASDRIALASTRAQPADPQEHARLHNLVEEMSIAAHNASSRRWPPE